MLKKWYFPKKMENSFSSRRWTNQNFLVETWEHPPWNGITQFEEKVEGIDFLGESDGSLLPPPQDSLSDASEAINDFWSMSGNFVYRHHVEPRVKLYSPREESFLIPLKYIDIFRTTHTNLEGQGDGSPRHVENRRRRGSRTCVCAITLLTREAHAGEEGRINILPWYRLVGVAETSSETQRR